MFGGAQESVQVTRPMSVFETLRVRSRLQKGSKQRNDVQSRSQRVRQRAQGRHCIGRHCLGRSGEVGKYLRQIEASIGGRRVSARRTEP